MRCAGCSREIEVGDRYIEDTPSGFIKAATDPEIDGLIAEIMGGAGGKVVYCDDCTVEGGDYLFETYYGEDSDAAPRHKRRPFQPPPPKRLHCPASPLLPSRPSAAAPGPAARSVSPQTGPP